LFKVLYEVKGRTLSCIN